MKPFATCAFVALLSGALGSLAPSSADLGHWEDFKALHGKKHAAHEDGLRMRRFLENKARIEAHNARYEAGLESFSLRLNQFSDLSSSEIDAIAFGFTPVNKTIPVVSAPPMGDIPVSLDYRQTGILTPVKQQGGCGSCYAFAAVGALEANLKKKTGQAYDLSEQDVVDCSFQRFNINGNLFNGGCSGGDISLVFEYYLQKDVVFEQEYPYIDGQGMCRAPQPIRNMVRSTLKYRHVGLQSEDEIKSYLATYGPVAIALVADGPYKPLFLNLGNGIFDVEGTINQQPNHAAVLVGYGTEGGKNYWILRNSWGTGWGVGGYGKIIAGKNMANLMAYGVIYLE